MISTESKIEAILFYKNEPLSFKNLAKMLEISENETRDSIEKLKEILVDRGLVLVQNNEEVSLATAPDAAILIEKIIKDELSKDLGKAGLETLSIVLYKGAVSRREIDYIRGVNSNFILRGLLVRGLVQRIENEKDGRTYLYKPTIELLAHLGLDSINKLPEFEKIRADLEQIKEKNDTE